MKRRYFEATVVDCQQCRQRTNDIFRLSLLINQSLEAKPGQFVTLESFCGGKIWRRPFSVYDQLQDKDSRDFSVCFKVVGENTRHYASLKLGDKISVLGPLGNPIHINENVENHILVAGGIGRAGLAYLTEELKRLDRRAIFLYGAKNDREVFDVYRLNNCCQRVEIVTEVENHMFATDLLNREMALSNYHGVNTEIIACGPNAMLEKVAQIADERGIPCQVIMEILMACGVGSCKGCAIPKKSGGYFHLCQDGPALPADLVDWEKLKRPSVIVTEERRVPVEKINMGVVLVGQSGKQLILPSPIILESGCLDEGAVIDGPVDLTYVGAIKSKGLTLEPRAGNPPPRVCETPSGMLNSIGLENVGLTKFISEQLPLRKSLGVEVIVNFSGATVHEFVEMAVKLAEAGVRVMELNLSCPNTEKGGQMFAVSYGDTEEVVAAVHRAVSEAFLLVKLSPMAPNVVDIAQAAAYSGADALSLFNTYLGMKIDLVTRRPAIGNIYGGMSGPEVRPMALRMVHLVCQKVSISVVASTGITCGEDAAEYLIVGAQAVAVGAGIFSNPNAGPEIFHGLRKIVSDYGMSDIKELVGSLIL